MCTRSGRDLFRPLPTVTHKLTRHEAAIEDVGRERTRTAKPTHVEPDVAPEAWVLMDHVAQRVEEVLCLLPGPARFERRLQLELLVVTDTTEDCSSGGANAGRE